MAEQQRDLAGIRALLFDFDGTLVEPSIDFVQMRRAVMEIVQAHGIDDDAQQRLGLARMHLLEIIAYVQERLTASGMLPEPFTHQAHEAILAIEIEAAHGVSAYPGVPDLLDELAHRGLGVAIVTRNCRPAVEAILRRIPMHHDVLLTRDDVEHVKPDPRHLLAALSHLGVPGEHAAMCGDHPMDITAGKAIGARTVGVLQPGVGPEHFAAVAPDLILPCVTGLLDHLDGRESCSGGAC
jgi:phosphoglycolate phosphatase